jgi:ornithine cyclodeaminase
MCYILIPVIILTEHDLRRLVPMGAAIEAVRQAFVAVAERRADQPRRLVSRDGRALSMMAQIEPGRDTVVKTVTISPDNRRMGLPTLHAVVLCFDGSTGQPTALIDGAAVTALRTGAASGVATDLFARRDARILALIGSGGQAKDQVEAVCAVRDITEIRIASRNWVTCQALAQRLRSAEASVRVTAHESTREAVANADVICCATTSMQPLFSRADLKTDAHVNAIGAYTPSMCELDPDVLADARIVAVDQLEAALEEAGDLIQAIEAGAISIDALRELGSLLSDSTRHAEGGLTVFKSVGIAAQDWAVTTLACECAAHLPGVQSVNLDGPGDLMPPTERSMPRGSKSR